jgi:hypothetical protein
MGAVKDFPWKARACRRKGLISCFLLKLYNAWPTATAPLM